MDTIKQGYLKIVTGCMFSGKTSYIIKECNKWKSIGKSVLIINFIDDNRFSNNDVLVSHDHFKIDCVKIETIDSFDVTGYDVIFINEAQFFTNLRKTVRYWCDALKKIVVVSGLDGDFRRERFGEIVDLLPDCDEYVKLHAYCSLCKDGTHALFTWKINGNNMIDIIDIGGSDKYIPVCRNHHNIFASSMQDSHV